jgi:hypothetical protein
MAEWAATMVTTEERGQGRCEKTDLRTSGTMTAWTGREDSQGSIP